MAGGVDAIKDVEAAICKLDQALKTNSDIQQRLTTFINEASQYEKRNRPQITMARVLEKGAQTRITESGSAKPPGVAPPFPVHDVSKILSAFRVSRLAAMSENPVWSAKEIVALRTTVDAHLRTQGHVNWDQVASEIHRATSRKVSVDEEPSRCGASCFIKHLHIDSSDFVADMQKQRPQPRNVSESREDSREPSDDEANGDASHSLDRDASAVEAPSRRSRHWKLHASQVSSFCGVSWSMEKDEELRLTAAKFGHLNWPAIAASVGLQEQYAAECMRRVQVNLQEETSDSALSAVDEIARVEQTIASAGRASAGLVAAVSRLGKSRAQISHLAQKLRGLSDATSVAVNTGGIQTRRGAAKATASKDRKVSKDEISGMLGLRSYALWTRAEDRQLLATVEILAGNTRAMVETGDVSSTDKKGFWMLVTKYVPNRAASSCRDRFMRLLPLLQRESPDSDVFLKVNYARLKYRNQ